MAHFAKIEDGVVTNVVVVDNEHEADGEAYLNSLGLEGKWVQTSYNSSIRKHYAGIGYIYNEDLDAFIPPKPHESWILDEDACVWVAPIDKPDTENEYVWDEDTQTWSAV